MTNGLISAKLTQSPASNPNIGQTVTYDGSTSTSSTGTRITNYNFDFGDGTPAQSGLVAQAKQRDSPCAKATIR